MPSGKRKYAKQAQMANGKSHSNRRQSCSDSDHDEDWDGRLNGDTRNAGMQDENINENRDKRRDRYEDYEEDYQNRHDFNQGGGRGGGGGGGGDFDDEDKDGFKRVKGPKFNRDKDGGMYQDYNSDGDETATRLPLDGPRHRTLHEQGVTENDTEDRLEDAVKSAQEMEELIQKYNAREERVKQYTALLRGQINDLFKEQDFGDKNTVVLGWDDTDDKTDFIGKIARKFRLTEYTVMMRLQEYKVVDIQTVGVDSPEFDTVDMNQAAIVTMPKNASKLSFQQKIAAFLERYTSNSGELQKQQNRERRQKEAANARKQRLDEQNMERREALKAEINKKQKLESDKKRMKRAQTKEMKSTREFFQSVFKLFHVDFINFFGDVKPFLESDMREILTRMQSGGAKQWFIGKIIEFCKRKDTAGKFSNYFFHFMPEKLAGKYKKPGQITEILQNMVQRKNKFVEITDRMISLCRGSSQETYIQLCRVFLNKYASFHFDMFIEKMTLLYARKRFIDKVSDQYTRAVEGGLQDKELESGLLSNFKTRTAYTQYITAYIQGKNSPDDNRYISTFVESAEIDNPVVLVQDLNQNVKNMKTTTKRVDELLALFDSIAKVDLLQKVVDKRRVIQYVRQNPVITDDGFRVWLESISRKKAVDETNALEIFRIRLKQMPDLVSRITIKYQLTSETLIDKLFSRMQHILVNRKMKQEDFFQDVFNGDWVENVIKNKYEKHNPQKLKEHAEKVKMAVLDLTYKDYRISEDVFVNIQDKYENLFEIKDRLEKARDLVLLEIEQINYKYYNVHPTLYIRKFCESGFANDKGRLLRYDEVLQLFEQNQKKYEESFSKCPSFKISNLKDDWFRKNCYDVDGEIFDMTDQLKTSIKKTINDFYSICKPDKSIHVDSALSDWKGLLDSLVSWTLEEKMWLYMFLFYIEEGVLNVVPKGEVRKSVFDFAKTLDTTEKRFFYAQAMMKRTDFHPFVAQDAEQLLAVYNYDIRGKLARWENACNDDFDEIVKNIHSKILHFAVNLDGEILLGEDLDAFMSILNIFFSDQEFMWFVDTHEYRLEVIHLCFDPNGKIREVSEVSEILKAIRDISIAVYCPRWHVNHEDDRTIGEIKYIASLVCNMRGELNNSYTIQAKVESGRPRSRQETGAGPKASAGKRWEDYSSDDEIDFFSNAGSDKAVLIRAGFLEIFGKIGLDGVMEAVMESVKTLGVNPKVLESVGKELYDVLWSKQGILDKDICIPITRHLSRMCIYNRTSVLSKFQMTTQLNNLYNALFSFTGKGSHARVSALEFLITLNESHFKYPDFLSSDVNKEAMIRASDLFENYGHKTPPQLFWHGCESFILNNHNMFYPKNKTNQFFDDLEKASNIYLSDFKSPEEQELICLIDKKLFMDTTDTPPKNKVVQIIKENITTLISKLKFKKFVIQRQMIIDDFGKSLISGDIKICDLQNAANERYMLYPESYCMPKAIADETLYDRDGEEKPYFDRKEILEDFFSGLLHKLEPERYGSTKADFDKNRYRFHQKTELLKYLNECNNQAWNTFPFREYGYSQPYFDSSDFLENLTGTTANDLGPLDRPLYAVLQSYAIRHRRVFTELMRKIEVYTGDPCIPENFKPLFKEWCLSNTHAKNGKLKQSAIFDETIKTLHELEKEKDFKLIFPALIRCLVDSEGNHRDIAHVQNTFKIRSIPCETYEMPKSVFILKYWDTVQQSRGVEADLRSWRQRLSRFEELLGMDMNIFSEITFDKFGDFRSPEQIKDTVKQINAIVESVRPQIKLQVDKSAVTKLAIKCYKDQDFDPDFTDEIKKFLVGFTNDLHEKNEKYKSRPKDTAINYLGFESTDDLLRWCCDHSAILYGAFEERDFANYHIIETVIIRNNARKHAITKKMLEAIEFGDDKRFRTEERLSNFMNKFTDVIIDILRNGRADEDKLEKATTKYFIDTEGYKSYSGKLIPDNQIDGMIRAGLGF